MTLRIERVGHSSVRTIRDLQFWVGPWVARMHWRRGEDGYRGYTLFPNGRPHWSGWHRDVTGHRHVPNHNVIPCTMSRMSHIMLKGAKDFEERKARLSEAAHVLAWEDYDRAEPLYWYPRPWSSAS